MSRLIVSLFLPFILLACDSPKSYLNEAIEAEGFLPHNQPLESASVGTLVGQTSNGKVKLVAPPEACFTEDVLKWSNETDLPEYNQNFEIGFNADINAALDGGNSTFKFKTSATHIKNVRMSFEDVKVESLNEVAFDSYYRNKMDDTCKSFLKKRAFLRDSLKVGKMSFQFFRASGAVISLDADNIGEIVDIEANVKWSINESYTLVIETPKHIGYQVARIKGDDGFVELEYASTVNKKGMWVFEDLSFALKKLLKGKLQ